RGGRAKRYCYWLADILGEIAIQYPGETLQSLLTASKCAVEDRAVYAEEYRRRHKESLVDRIETRWKSESMYDELREILTDDIVMRDADLFASQHTNGTLKPAKKDKGEEWYEKLVEVFFKVFDSSKRDFWMHSWWHIDNEMKDWHLSRLERELNSTSEAYTVSDGWSIPEGTTMVVGTCHICYAKADRKSVV